MRQFEIFLPSTAGIAHMYANKVIEKMSRDCNPYSQPHNLSWSNKKSDQSCRRKAIFRKNRKILRNQNTSKYKNTRIQARCVTKVMSPSFSVE